MTPSPEYFELAFQEDQDELARTRQLVGETAKTFPSLAIGNVWPYEVVNGGNLEVPGTYSQSTNAMILFALAAAAGRVRRSCPLLAGVRLRQPVDFGEWPFDGAWSRLIEETGKNDAFVIEPGPPLNAHISYSGTFGWDDPFSLSWLLDLLHAKGFDNIFDFGRSGV